MMRLRVIIFALFFIGIIAVAEEANPRQDSAPTGIIRVVTGHIEQLLDKLGWKPPKPKEPDSSWTESLNKSAPTNLRATYSRMKDFVTEWMEFFYKLFPSLKPPASPWKVFLNFISTLREFLERLITRPKERVPPCKAFLKDPTNFKKVKACCDYLTEIVFAWSDREERELPGVNKHGRGLPISIAIVIVFTALYAGLVKWTPRRLKAKYKRFFLSHRRRKIQIRKLKMNQLYLDPIFPSLPNMPYLLHPVSRRHLLTPEAMTCVLKDEGYTKAEKEEIAKAQITTGFRFGFYSLIHSTRQVIREYFGMKFLSKNNLIRLYNPEAMDRKKARRKERKSKRALEKH